MKELITNSYEEFVETILNAEKEGLRVACISNAGLDLHQRRITLLPKECFATKYKQTQKPVDINTWLEERGDENCRKNHN